MHGKMTSPRQGATAEQAFSVRNTRDSVPMPFPSLMAAFETPVSRLRDGATIEHEGRIVATYFTKRTALGRWCLWFYGGAS
jgi:hypothetical protein